MKRLLQLLCLLVFGSIAANAQTPLVTCGSIILSGSYALQNNVSSTGTCFTVTATDVVLDLGGFTVTYGSAGTAQSFGVDASTATSTGLQVFNGTFTQHANISLHESATSFSHVIHCGTGSNRCGGTGAAIHDLTVNIHGRSSAVVKWGGSKLDIYNLTVNSTVITIDSRNSFDGALINSTGSGLTPTGQSEIYNNTFSDTAQNCIVARTSANIHDNTCNFNPGAWWWQDSCIVIGRVTAADDSIVADNTCTATSASGRGILVDGGNAASPVDGIALNTNTITVRSLAQYVEGSGTNCVITGGGDIQRTSNTVTVNTFTTCSALAVGKRVRISGTSQTYLGNFTVATKPSATQFTYADTRGDAAQETTGGVTVGSCEGSGTFATQLEGNTTNIVWTGGTYIAISEESCSAAALRFNPDEAPSGVIATGVTADARRGTTPGATRAISSGGSFLSAAGVIVTSSTIVTDQYGYQPDDSLGTVGSNIGITIKDSTMTKGTNPAATLHAYCPGTASSEQVYVVFKNINFTNGMPQTDCVGTTGSTGTHQIDWRRDVTITVKESLSPFTVISGATVSVDDAVPATVCSGTTNGSGQLACDLFEYVVTNNAGGRIQTAKTPHSIDVSKSGYTTSNNNPLTVVQGSGAQAITIFLDPTGGGTAPLVSLDVSSLSFAATQVEVAAATQDITLTNTGDATLNITSIVTAGVQGVDFTNTTTCGATVLASANCTVTVTFRPKATGAKTGTVTFTTDAAGSPHVVTLSGTATGIISFGGGKPGQ